MIREIHEVYNVNTTTNNNNRKKRSISHIKREANEANSITTV